MQNNTFSVEGLFDFLNAGVSAFRSTAAAVKLLVRTATRTAPRVQPGSWCPAADITPPATALPCWHGGCPRVS